MSNTMIKQWSKAKEKWIDLFFKVMIWIKGIDGVVDLLGSIVFALSRPSNVILFLFQKELMEDPYDQLAHYLINLTEQAHPGTRLFIVIYLAIHGLIKIGMVYALHRKSHLAYKIAAAILSVFLLYQIYRFSHTGSNILLLAILFDAIMLWLIKHEYKKLKH